MKSEVLYAPDNICYIEERNKLMKSPKLLLSLFTIVLLSCGGSDDDTTEPEVTVDPDPIPEQTSTYNAHVKTIIDTNCIECHGTPLQNSAPMALETFQIGVLKAPTSFRILKAIPTGPGLLIKERTISLRKVKHLITPILPQNKAAMICW